MEFGIFLNGYLPGQAAHDPACEHEMFKREMAYVIEADKYNWKYAWVGEHHALTEYSHMSSPEVVMGYLAHATERIHIGTGIMNLSPRVNHPVRCAERVAMLDHLLEGRFEWGTGRGAGSHEIATFNNLDKNSTKAEWNEVIRQIPRMWEEKDYMYEGESFTVPYPHNVLPKPYQGKGHPPIWVGCGNPGTFTQAGELGIGAIAFNFEPIYNLKGRIDAYKEGIANCTEPLGQFKNDNVMMTNAVICLNDRQEGPRGGSAPRSRLPLLAGVQLPRHHPAPGGCAGLARTAPHHHRREHARLPDRERVDAVRRARRGGRAGRQVPDRRMRPAGLRTAVGLVDGGRGARDAGGVRYQGDSPVRPRSGPLDHPLPPVGAAEVQDFNFPIPDITVQELPTNAMIQLDGTRVL